MLGNKWREESGKIGKNGGFFLLIRNGACSWRIPQTTHFLFIRAHVWTQMCRSAREQRSGIFVISARTPPLGRIARWGRMSLLHPGVKIGNFCKIQNNVSVYDGVELGDYVFCGPSMVLPMCSGLVANIRNPGTSVLCADAGVRRRQHRRKRNHCGHRIGRHAFIAAGSVVTKDVPDMPL